jgi:hypothetical protein
VGFRVLQLEVLDESEELLAATLFEEAHEIGLEGLGVGGRHLLDFVASLAEEALLLGLEDVGPVDALINSNVTLPLEILGYSGFEEDLDKLATAHDVLGD